MDDRTLSELLELADQELPLPDDLEDRLLDDVLATYRRPVTVDGHDGGREPDPAADNVIVIGERRESGRDVAARRRLAIGAAAAAAMVLVAFVFAGGGDEAERTETSPTAPTAGIAAVVPTPDPAFPVSPVVGDLSDLELCTALDQELVASGVSGPVVLVEMLDAGSVQRVVTALDELIRRVGQDASIAAATSALLTDARVAIENLRLEIERGTDASVGAAYPQARSAVALTEAVRSEFCST